MNNIINIDADLSEDLKKISKYNGNSITEQIIEFLLSSYSELVEYEHDDLEEIKVSNKRGSYVLSLPDTIYQIILSISNNTSKEIFNMINDDIEKYIDSNYSIIENYDENDYDNEDTYEEEYSFDEEDYEEKDDDYEEEEENY